MTLGHETYLANTSFREHQQTIDHLTESTQEKEFIYEDQYARSCTRNFTKSIVSQSLIGT